MAVANHHQDRQAAHQGWIPALELEARRVVTRTRPEALRRMPNPVPNILTCHH